MAGVQNMKSVRRKIYAVITILIITVAFYAYFRAQVSDIQSTGDSKKADLNNNINTAGNFIQALTLYGNNFFERGSSEDSKLFPYVKYDSKTDSYDMDSVAGTEYAGKSGNITGLGPIPENGLKRDDINLALYYNEFFSRFYSSLPNVAWIYYTSRYDYINMYPWISSKDFHYTEKLKSVAFYHDAMPMQNPDRKAVWTPVYQDEGGKGRMVTLSSPVYKDNIFMGVVSIDFTIKILSDMLDCKYDVYLVDHDHSVIASNQGNEPEPNSMGLDQLIHLTPGDLATMDKMTNQSVRQIGMNYIYKCKFEDAPWSIVVCVPVYAVLFKSILYTLPVILVCILLLLTLREAEYRKAAETTIQKIAITDELTGLNNRHYLDSVIETELARSDRYVQPLSFMILDLDHFKKVNDTWGHPVGDDVLKQTAEIIKSHIRKADVLVRLGGEEFLIMLPHTNGAGAAETAEKIRLALDERRHPVAGKCTSSFGVVERKYGESYISLYKRVDEALYLAKEGGRNRVVLQK